MNWTSGLGMTRIGAVEKQVFSLQFGGGDQGPGRKRRGVTLTEDLPEVVVLRGHRRQVWGGAD